MIISWYLQENGEDEYLNDDPEYVVVDVLNMDIADNDANGSNKNDDEYVRIDKDEDGDDDDDDCIH